MDGTNTLMTKEDFQIFKGKTYLPWVKMSNPISIDCSPKVIVFDLDETLGSFSDLYVLWRGLRHITPTFNHFSGLLDLYPEFLRYGMITILQYVFDRKLKEEIKNVFLYTNNQCGVEWVQMIIEYLQTKMSSNSIPLFDQLICAYKRKNKQIELLRTSHMKSVEDFKRCSNISEGTNICFIDDKEYDKMKQSQVYYICPRSYRHPLNTAQIIRRLHNAPWFLEENHRLLHNETFWKDWFSFHRRTTSRNRNTEELVIDLQVSTKLFAHLRDFIHFSQKEGPSTTPTFTKRIRPEFKMGCLQTRKKRGQQKIEID